MEQGVDQGAVGVSRRGVYHHTDGLVDHQKVPVLVHHVQRNILRLCGRGGGVGQIDGQDVACRHKFLLSDRGPVAKHAPRLTQTGGGSTGEIAHRRKVGIRTDAHLFGIDCKALFGHCVSLSARRAFASRMMSRKSARMIRPAPMHTQESAILNLAKLMILK